MTDFAYVARGKLFVQLEGEPAREVESPFAQKVVARAASIARKNAWKTEGRGARFMMGMGGAPEDVLDQRTIAPVRFTGVTRGRTPAEILYTLSTGPVAGLFSFSGGEEVRLFHGAEAPIAEPTVHADGETVACTLGGKAGLSHIAILRDDGMGVRAVTEGDTMDTSPAWVPGAGKRLVYQSAGIGRDAAGNPIALGCSAVCQLDLESGALETLVEKDGFDHASPRMSEDGTLYFVRRPHPTVQTFSPLRALLDVILFPFRLAWAVFQWFNFFSIRYTGKPLSTSGNARGRNADLRRVLVAGNVANAAQDASAEDAGPPPSWELVERRGGKETVVARRVLAYDLAPDGALLFTNGREIRHVDRARTDTTLAKAEDITMITALPAADEDEVEERA